MILTNDDGDPSARTFARILERYGLVGNYFVNNVSPLTRRQIRSLAQRGSVEAHTVSHVALSGLDYEDQVAEIAENQAYLEEITGQPVRFLAWPYGDVNESAIEAAAAAGIVVAFGLGATAADLDTTDWYAIPRMTIFVDDDLETFAAKVTGGRCQTSLTEQDVIASDQPTLAWDRLGSGFNRPGGDRGGAVWSAASAASARDRSGAWT